MNNPPPPQKKSLFTVKCFQQKTAQAAQGKSSALVPKIKEWEILFLPQYNVKPSQYSNPPESNRIFLHFYINCQLHCGYKSKLNDSPSTKHMKALVR